MFDRIGGGDGLGGGDRGGRAGAQVHEIHPPDGGGDENAHHQSAAVALFWLFSDELGLAGIGERFREFVASVGGFDFVVLHSLAP